MTELFYFEILNDGYYEHVSQYDWSPFPLCKRPVKLVDVFGSVSPSVCQYSHG